MKARLSEKELKQVLVDAGVGLTAQRIAIARYVLVEGDHPTASEVLENVSKTLSMVSKATVYNTLSLFVESGLLVEVSGGPQDPVRYDGNTVAHHHLRDHRTGRLIDIPYEDIEIANLDALKKRYNATRLTVIIDGEPSGG